jgi:hypothetical protein
VLGGEGPDSKGIHEIGARTCGSTPGLDKGPTKSHPGPLTTPATLIGIERTLLSGIYNSVRVP